MFFLFARARAPLVDPEKETKPPAKNRRFRREMSETSFFL